MVETRRVVHMPCRGRAACSVLVYCEEAGNVVHAQSELGIGVERMGFGWVGGKDGIRYRRLGITIEIAQVDSDTGRGKHSNAATQHQDDTGIEP